MPVLRGGGRVRAAAQSVPVPPTAPGGCGVPSLASSLAVAGQPRAVRSEEKQVAAPWDAGRCGTFGVGAGTLKMDGSAGGFHESGPVKHQCHQFLLLD